MAPIVGLGELLWDLFPDGRKVAGGAPFNFAYHCHQLGHPARIVSRVGDDDLGRELRDRVRALGLSDESIQIDRERPTGTVRVTLAADGQPSYEIVEGVAWDALTITPELEALAAEAGAVCFGTLGQRHPTARATIRQVLTRHQERASRPWRVFDVNIRQHFFSRQFFDESMAVAEWLKLNHEEEERLVTLEGSPGITGCLGTLQSTSGQGPVIIVTRGSDGARIVTPDGIIDQPGVPAKVVDTVGAGDALTAAMLCLRREGRSLAEAIRFATVYAARVCEGEGGTPRVDRRDVERQVFGA